MVLHPLHSSFAVEVDDFDPAFEPSSSQLHELRSALDHHHLLVFRLNSPLPPERQVKITSWFGSLVPTGENGRYWTVLDNTQNASGREPLRFHSDLTFTEAPFEAIALHALAIPEGGTSTVFASGVDAWQRLGQERQVELATKTVRHCLPATDLFGEGWPDFIADQPLRLIHPRTGQPVLFVTEEHARRIHELPEEQSDKVLDELFTALYAPECVYEHHWRPYDLVLWDNLALQHSRPAAAEPGDGARVMQRTVLGTKTFQELMAQARPG
ncbi:TauD/TfdA family dioxygenase [Mangrovimicrobium sediminis]|uniref:TauD/TfdA family dioxygenase n=1 Tax=Mangrovimicrobium sediminis TaxID=2562682 RepID=A0A4Z0M3A0_9GAMM|nr:TauD/TfdA family dioxygenase [Haliea sp. SAOS-164]TGD74163.1 TauD/TfdA family dioxygenase [Haliea sp. SAOS-164]